MGPLSVTAPAEPLPAEFEEFMQNTGNEGVILVSFGTVLGNVEEKKTGVAGKCLVQSASKGFMETSKGYFIRYAKSEGETLEYNLTL